jgi:hypothetical protein
MDRVGPRRLRLESQSLHVDRGQPVLARELAAQAHQYKWTTCDAGNWGDYRPSQLNCTYHRV